MSKRWEIRPVDEALVRRLASRSGLPMPVACALALRGITDEQALDAFLHPRLADLADPFLLPGIAAAADRIWKAIDVGETIAVFGDYDVDGVTSSALLLQVLAALGARVEAFIPDRLDEGYGFSSEALDRCLALHRPALIVTVDCGTNSVESVDAARRGGVDVIVTDHHEPEAETAAPLALVNPKLGTDPALANLSGVGVAFKLAHALLKAGRGQGRPAVEAVDLRDYLDLAALGTVADIVPLVGENRIIVRHGLERLHATRWEGLRALKAVAGIRDMPDTYHLGFQLGPRINAAGRIAQPMEALRLLTTGDPAEARRIAQVLDDTNAERQRLERSMVEEAFEEIDASFDPARSFGLVMARPGWHPGVVGIVASRVARRYNRPAIVMGIGEDGHAHGSCRSIDEFDMLHGLSACRELLLKFGGHKMAAGVAVAGDRLAAFHEAFNAVAAKALEGIDLSPVQRIDAEVCADELDEEFHGRLRLLQPFGQDNPEPVFALRGARCASPPRVVGANHLKFAVQAGGRRFDAIAFNFADDRLPEGPFDIAFALKENAWNGSISLQLQVRDVRPAGEGGS